VERGLSRSGARATTILTTAACRRSDRHQPCRADCTAAHLYEIRYRRHCVCDACSCRLFVSIDPVRVFGRSSQALYLLVMCRVVVSSSPVLSRVTICLALFLSAEVLTKLSAFVHVPPSRMVSSESEYMDFCYPWQGTERWNSACYEKM